MLLIATAGSLGLCSLPIKHLWMTDIIHQINVNSFKYNFDIVRVFYVLIEFQHFFPQSSLIFKKYFGKHPIFHYIYLLVSTSSILANTGQ